VLRALFYDQQKLTDIQLTYSISKMRTNTRAPIMTMLLVPYNVFVRVSLVNLIKFSFLLFLLFATGWATVCKTVRPTLSVRCPVCPSVLSVCNIRALWPNGWMDQDKTSHAGRARPRTHYVRWGSSSPSPKGAQPPIFGPYLLWTNGWMHKDVTWYGGRPQPRELCVRWRPSPLSNKGAEPPNFRPMSVVAKRLDGSRWHLAWM